MTQRVAIIGGGIAGLTAGYLLNDLYDITLFEKQERLGGNAYTYRTNSGEEVDIAVAAFGIAGYSNFYKLLDRLGIETAWVADSYMSLQDLNTGDGWYITPLSLKAILKQKLALFHPKHGLSALGLFAGLRRANKLLLSGRFRGLTLNCALDYIPELRGEARRLFLCAICLMSSMSGEEVLKAPAEFVFEKLSVHHDVISPKAVYSVRCVEGKTKSYVEALASTFAHRIKMGSDVKTVERDGDKVTLVMGDGERSTFDKVVFACHADHAFKLLAEPTENEQALLGAWRYKDGSMTLHNDHSSFPPRELTQAYTFLYREEEGKFDTSVSGATWHEPGVSPDCDLISTQHPNFPIDKDKVEFETVLRTPIFDFNSYSTVRRLPSLNGTKNAYYCGSYFGHGLHEDAVRSAIAVARQLGASW